MHSAWTTAKLGTNASVVASNVDKHVHADEIPVRLCNYLDVYRNRRLSKPYQFSQGTVTQAELDRFTIRKGDVLITKDSETPDDIGVPCLIAGDFENTVCGYHLALIRAKDVLNPGFLSYLFESEATRRYFLAKAAGLTRFGLNARIIRGVPVPMPPPDEQAAIADVLDAVECAISNTRAVIPNAEHLQKGLMQQLLTGGLKLDGTPRTEKDFWAHSKAGYVPIGWDVAPLKQLAQVRRGKFSHRPRNEPRFYDGPFPFIQTGDVSNSRGYILSHAQTLSDEGARISRRFQKGTVFISIVGVNVAATAIAAYDVYATDSVIGMIPNAGVVSEYLEFYLRSVQQRLAVLAGDSARENLNYGILKPLLIKYPTDPEEQQRIADVLCNCDSFIRAKEQKIAALQRMKKSLMQNLLTGRVRLTVNEAFTEVRA